jgi:hypothetical protein
VKKTSFWRFLEIFPGALVWSGILLPIIFSIIWPSAVALYILIFDLYWLINALLYAGFTLKTYRIMRRTLRTDFSRMLEALPQSPGGEPTTADHKQIYHVVMFATFREEQETLEPSIESIIEADWPTSRKIVMLAGEERDRERLQRLGKYFKDKYKNKLFDFIVSEHPDGIEGEVRGKGAGCHWAGEQLSEYALAKGLDEENIIVTVADADTRFPRQFLNCTAYHFVTNPNRHRRSYQPIPIYSNNIWQAHPIPRLVAWGSSFWQMIEASRPWRLINFSTHSYSLKMLREMNYWAVDVVNEDSRQFWRAYFAFNGDHQVVPIYMPIYMDAVFAEDLWTTLKNQYLQKRRWAYGIEHFPYIVTESIKHKEISFYDRFIKIYRLIKGTYDWSTASFYLSVVAWLPIIFSEQFRHTVLAQNLPLLVRLLLSIAWIAVILSIYVSFSFLPPRPASVRKTKYIEMALEWFITPLSAVIWGSLPALEAQTRFMLGKYLTFWVTPKNIKK